MSKILVVDDNSDIVTVLRATFEGAKHEVIGTTHPKEVLQLAERHGPDALVLDVMMPGMTGWEILAELRRRPRLEALPVVLLTALSEVSDRVRGLRDGADDYQVKPFEPEELLARVEGLIARTARRAPRVDVESAPEPPASVPTSLALEEAIELLEERILARCDLGEVCLGRYQVEKLIGRGAMGTVFRGWDPKLQRPVALKTIRFDIGLLEREVQVSRLLEEAVVSARFNHPHIVTVYDLGDQGNAAFIAMELIEGASLEVYLAQHSPLHPDQVIPLAAATARALEAAHGNGLVHRDIKPANILLSHDGAIKVTDFGISELILRTGPSGSIFGTPGYLAPECLNGESAQPASDLFSLGVVLYESLTGHHPFLGRNWHRTLHNTIMADPEPIGVILPKLPQRVAAVIDALLAKEPRDRPKDASVVAEVFEDLTQRGGLSWRPSPMPVSEVAEASRTVPCATEALRPGTTRSRVMSLRSLGPLALQAALA